MKITQIAAASIDAKDAVVFALCEDGSLWKKVVNPADNAGRNWVRVPGPLDDPAEDDPMPFAVG